MSRSSRIPLVLGNWKMNTTIEDAQALAGSTNAAASEHPDVEVGVMPPAVWLVPIATHLGSNPAVQLGAQNVAAEPSGAFTGDISAEMLAPYARFMLAGHSERRHIRGETDDEVRAKVDAIFRVDRIPVLAVGETESQRQSGRAAEIVSTQLHAALHGRSGDQIERLVIAYEPVWAIGTGNAATASDAAEMGALVREWLRHHDKAAADRARILYGGSVNAGNAADLFAIDDIDGALVGGASLNPTEFAAIIAAAGTPGV